MKTKILLGLTVAGLGLAATAPARAGFSLDVSIGSHSPHSRPVVVAPAAPPVVYSPPQVISYPAPAYNAPVDNCAPAVVGYQAPVVVAPPPVVVTQPYYRDHYYRPGYRRVA